MGHAVPKRQRDVPEVTYLVWLSLYHKCIYDVSKEILSCAFFHEGKGNKTVQDDPRGPRVGFGLEGDLFVGVKSAVDVGEEVIFDSGIEDMAVSEVCQQAQ